MPEAPVARWRMLEEQKALFPEVSGNDINGLGVSQFRRPSIVYWPNDRAFDSIPHGQLCKFMVRHQSPDVTAVFRDPENRAPLVLDPVAGARVEASPRSLPREPRRSRWATRRTCWASPASIRAGSTPSTRRRTCPAWWCSGAKWPTPRWRRRCRAWPTTAPPLRWAWSTIRWIGRPGRWPTGSARRDMTPGCEGGPSSGEMA